MTVLGQILIQNCMVMWLLALQCMFEKPCYKYGRAQCSLNCRHSQQQSSVKCQKELKEQNFHLRKCFDQLYKETNFLTQDSLALRFLFIANYCHCNLTPFTALCAISACMSVLTYFAYIFFLFFTALQFFCLNPTQILLLFTIDVLQIFPLSKLTVGLQPPFLPFFICFA